MYLKMSKKEELLNSISKLDLDQLEYLNELIELFTGQLNKGALMQFTGKNSNCDTAIPINMRQDIEKAMGTEIKTYFYVMDYQNKGAFGEIKHLGECLVNQMHDKFKFR